MEPVKKTATDSGKGIPVIPRNATIQTLTWSDSRNDMKFSAAYVVRDGVVTGRSRNNFDVEKCKMQDEGSFEGTIRDNIISGVWASKLLVNCALDRGCASSQENIGRSNEVVTFNTNGTLDVRVTGGSVTAKTTVSGCQGEVMTASGNVPPSTLRGTWKFAK